MFERYPGFLGTSQRYIPKAYPYVLQPFSNTIPPYNVPPYNALTDYPLAIDLNTVKNYLKISLSNTADDALIILLIGAAVSFGESYTRRDFITKTYLTYRDTFNEPLFTLRKSRFQNLISFQYLVNNVLTTVPSVYYTTISNDYSDVRLNVNSNWPTDIDIREQAVQIILTAGYSPDASLIPSQLKAALMQHIAQMYENRGDATPSGSFAADALPPTAKIIYNMYRINSLSLVPY